MRITSQEIFITSMLQTWMNFAQIEGPPAECRLALKDLMGEYPEAEDDYQKA